jgi:hypothetical protein
VTSLLISTNSSGMHIILDLIVVGLYFTWLPQSDFGYICFQNTFLSFINYLFPYPHCTAACLHFATPVLLNFRVLNVPLPFPSPCWLTGVLFHSCTLLVPDLSSLISPQIVYLYLTQVLHWLDSSWLTHYICIL